MFAKTVMIVCTVLGSVALGGPARAHGDIQGTDPAPLSRVRRAPRSVAVTFTEAPTAEAVFEVTDGCGRKVGQGVDVSGATATVRTATGQPGRWRVSYRVISSVDGHETHGGYAFTVAGDKDCTPDPKPTDHSGMHEDPKAPNPTASPGTKGPGETNGSSAPVVPIAIGAVAVVVAALIVRRSGSG